MSDASDTSLGTGRRGVVLVLSSPSGAGKTTLSRRLLEDDAKLSLSVSVTTRAPRNGEVDGRDYTFIDVARFERMRDDGELLEWAEVFGQFYGTPRAPVAASLSAGRDMLFDIDWQGARQVKMHLPDDVVTVFILPPDGQTLERRLRTRGQDSAEIVARRMAAAAGEITHWPEYDYLLVNRQLEASGSALRAILAAERLKRARQMGAEAFVERILAEL